MSSIDVSPPVVATRLLAFSTSSYADQEGFAYWREEICRHLSPSETSSLFPKRPFAAQLRRVSFGSVGLCDIGFSAMRNVRDARSLRRMPDDDVFVALMKNGSGVLEQRGRHADLVPGDIVLYDSTRTFDWSFREASRLIVARVPRRQMVARLPELDELTARVIRADHPLAAIIGTTLSEMMRLGEATDADRSQRLGRSIVDMIATSVEASLIVPDRDILDDDLLRRAKAFLIDNIEDPDIDLDSVTHHLGVSVRTLCRAFASDGTTAIRWLWRERLELAFRLLSEKQVRSVSQVVMLCGFSDFSHFSRSFKKAYGVMPKAVLNGTAAAN